MPTKAEFRAELQSQLRQAELQGVDHFEISSGALHRKLGGYPPALGDSHQMPTCCTVMYDEMRAEDVIVSAPNRGKGATLTIRYALPRR
jgi:hypothetical protein